MEKPPFKGGFFFVYFPVARVELDLSFKTISVENKVCNKF